jgi:hypothetical protein
MEVVMVLRVDGKEIATIGLSMKKIGCCVGCGSEPSLLYGIFWNNGDKTTPICMPCLQAGRF